MTRCCCFLVDDRVSLSDSGLHPVRVHRPAGPERDGGDRAKGRGRAVEGSHGRPV